MDYEKMWKSLKDKIDFLENIYEDQKETIAFQNNEKRQSKGKQNRTLTQEEQDFLDKWKKIKNIN